MTLAALHSSRDDAVGQTDAPVDLIINAMLERGLIDDKALERAQRLAVQNGGRVDAVLLQLGLISERDLAEVYAKQLELSLLTPKQYPDKPILSDRLKAKFLRKARAVPVAVHGQTIYVAVTDPLDVFIKQSIAAATGMTVGIAVAVPIELEAALKRLYPESDAAMPETEDSEALGEPLEGDTERLKDLASEAPVIRLVNQIMTRAVETQASDIHIEPFEDRLRVRYRYDGILHEAESPPIRLHAAIISRIKIMARLDIAERRLPQDGRVNLAIRGQEIDFRVSTVPSLYGEMAVLRILDRGSVEFDFDKLGLPPQVSSRLQEALQVENGIVLVTGPTGSGKTTTLYTGLLQINSGIHKIITLEDPIEYHLAGITQIQVQPQIGLTFDRLLRSVVRLDPNVIMVGEIRDIETAQAAVQAALTGHLVLSTLHTNSAAATIARLHDMGLEEYLIATVLRGVLAQRLVRRLCPHCKEAGIASAEMIERFGLESRITGRPILLWQPKGCDLCRSTGYRGRMAISEFLTADVEVRRLIFAKAGHEAIEKAAVTAGMVTMFDAGLDAALAGETTIEEVIRSIRSEI